MKKKAPLLFVFLLVILSLNLFLISAINLDISAKPISNSVIIDLNEPAVYELIIRNLGETDNFEIYSLVGIDITPSTPFEIKSGETKTLKIELMPQESLKTKKQLPMTFEYKIKNSKNEIQKQTLSIYILDLESSFLIQPQNINPNSEKIIISIKNNVFFNFSELKIKLTSAFFENEQTISLQPKQIKEMEIPIDKEKTKILNAGNYLMNIEIITNEKTANIESQIKFLQQEDIETTENKEGFIIQRTELIKKNTGNIKKTIEITAEKNLLSYLFTSVNPELSETEIKNFKKFYIWKKELIPNEEIKVVIKTNWFIPIFIIIFIIIAIVLIKKSVYNDLILRKKVSFVKTKGGQFALKITLIIKAKRFIERINLVDKLPHLVQLYNKFGAIEPDKIDLKNRRLEYNIESLNKDESRIFSYIVYSKIGVVGRFELPNAKATYEKDGKVKHSVSNRSFFINEPRG